MITVSPVKNSGSARTIRPGTGGGDRRAHRAPKVHAGVRRPRFAVEDASRAEVAARHAGQRRRKRAETFGKGDSGEDVVEARRFCGDARDVRRRRLDELAGDPKPPRGKRPRRHGNRAAAGEFASGRRRKVDSERRRARCLRHVHAHEGPPGPPVLAWRKGQRSAKRRPSGVGCAFGSVDDEFEYAPRLCRAAADGDAERRWRLRERKARGQ